MARTILVIDVEGFGDLRRTNPNRIAVRECMYQALRMSFTAAGVPWSDCDLQDQGDGVFVLAPPTLPKAAFVESMPVVMAATLHQHNATHPVEERVRVRMVLHAGEVTYDVHGLTSHAVNHAFRLLEAAPLKAALADSSGVLAVIVSEWFFDEVVRHSTVIDPATFRSVRIRVKETTTVGWIALPDDPYPSDPGQLTAPPRDSTVPVPRQFPPAPYGFSGRTIELSTLTAALYDVTRPGATVVITAIAGVGGIGKSWLALHWAHQHMDRFPDGQLHVNLRGFGPTRVPMAVAVAIRGFLDALGVDPAVVPANLDAQIGLYRSLVAGKRMLIMLDNAADASQVAPLLPGSTTCTVLITSRHKLAGLVTAHGARPLILDVLSRDEARQLLINHLGPIRVNQESAAVDELLEHCAGLPLALGIVAARAVTCPNLPMAQLAKELRDHTARLDGLDVGDTTVNLRAVFSWSYQALTPDAAEAFGLLGSVLGPDISLPAAAALLARPASPTGVLLRELENANLVQQYQPGRYRVHDLVRLYAAERATTDQSDEKRAAAIRRLIDFYIHTADAGDRLLAPHRQPLKIEQPALGCVPLQFTNSAEALAWFDSEHACLLMAHHTAVDNEWHLAVWQLAWALTTFRWRQGHVHTNVAAWTNGLQAAVHLADPLMQAHAHRLLGRTCVRAGRLNDAINQLQQALTLAKQSGDASDQAYSHYALASALAKNDTYEPALQHAICAYDLYHALAHPVWMAGALGAMGRCYSRLGNYEQASACCESSLALYREHNYQEGEADTLDSLGYIAHQTGRDAQAADYYRQALVLRQNLGNAFDSADTLACLGEVQLSQQQQDEGIRTLLRALDLYHDQHRATDAAHLQQRLATLGYRHLPAV